jgi:2-polyprenyl-3-methyl-5-hydroxy-6-metoxy-1,4-benzoquinol methylase
MAEIIASCPVCGNIVFTHFLDVTDHFLTQEEFSIQECNSCRFRFINPRPGKQEIGRYYQSEEYISHDSGKNDLQSRIYKFARILSIRKKFSIVRNYSFGGTILDIGCGTGEFLYYCRKKNFEVKGVEPNGKARAFALSKNEILANEHLESLSDSPGSFNCITMWHVLEHIHNLNDLVIQAKRLLAPEGVFIVAVPNSNSWDAEKYQKFWAAYDVPRHLYHFTKETMQKLASRNGLEIIKIYPQGLDAYYVSLLSEKYLTGKTNYLKSILFGFWSNLQAKKQDIGHSSLIFVMKAEKT